MIISKITKIRLNGSNISYFRDLGYCGKLHDIIKVKVDDLKLNSNSKIRVKCDVCGFERELKYQSYNQNVNNGGYYSCSRKCCQKKIENTCKDKYGCKNPFQNEEVKDNIKKELMNKYGVCHPMRSDKIKEKLKNTNIEKYGCEWVFNNNEIKDKIFKTMIEKYGYKYALQNYNILNKQKDSYNIEDGFKNAIRIKKYKNTNLYYQGSYEKDFLELCGRMNILDYIKNGNCYNYLKEDNEFGIRTLTDFSYKDYEIEIKSTFILEKQGGESKLNAKRRAVEKNGKTYIFILDKNYNEFKKIISRNHE